MINLQGIKYLISVKKKDSYTFNHLMRLKKLLKVFSKYKKFEKHNTLCLEYMAIYHDAGKLLIDTDILTKAGKLTDEEFALMKRHTNLGVNFVSIIPKEYKNEIVDGILNHHYLNGYFENDTPTYLTKIVSIFDVYEALTSKRPYKDVLSFEKTMSIIKKIYEKHPEDLYIYEEFCDFIKYYKSI